MKIGVIIPTRGDRPLLLKNCLRQLKAQTLQPTEVAVIDYVPFTKEKDLTQRYRKGYDQLRQKNLDVIALIEDDDFYSHEYLEVMTNEWIKQGRPNLLGTTYTIYYNIRMFNWLTFLHNTRSSAMSTLIAPDLNFKWCADNEPYFDIHIWKLLYSQGKLFTPKKHICLGIKHGEGLCGGNFHTDRKDRYENPDPAKSFLRENMDAESFNFYANYFPNTIEQKSNQV